MIFDAMSFLFQTNLRKADLLSWQQVPDHLAEFEANKKKTLGSLKVQSQGDRQTIRTSTTDIAVGIEMSLHSDSVTFERSPKLFCHDLGL